MKKAGVKHCWRIANRDWYRETAAELRKAIETESAAKYWIENR